VLLVLNQFSAEHRWRLAELLEFVAATGRLLVELVAVLAGVGLIVGALSVTGLSGTLVNDLLYLAGDSVWLMLLMGAATSFVLGIGMTVTAAYIFLAVVLAPALISAGLNAMAVHLFILYWAMLSFITPPVALGAYAAASIASASPMRAGFAAMRLGSVIYFIPFIFVLEPSLMFQDEAQASGPEVALGLVEAFAGVWLIAGGLQGYLPVLGTSFGVVTRIMIVLGGFLIAMPGLQVVGAPWMSNLAQLGAGIVAVGIGVLLRYARGLTR